MLLAALLALIALNPEATRRGKHARTSEFADSEAFRDEYRTVGGWPVALTVTQGAAVTGGDRGVVWFEDGRLFFNGERTSFGLVASQVHMDGKGLSNEMGTAFSLPLRTGGEGGPASIRLALLLNVSFGAEGYRGGEAFARELGEWLRADAAGEGQLPPLALGPDAPTTRDLLVRAILTTSVGVGSLVATIALGWVGYRTGHGEGIASVALPLIMIGLIVLFCWPEVLNPWICWRAWRDRRRLEEAPPGG